MFNPSEDLLNRLAAPDPDPAAVLEYLEGQRAEAGDDARAVDSFFTASDLDQYRAAMDWWPKDADLPAPLAPPTLFMLCFRYDVSPDDTFLSRLTERANKAAMWSTSTESAAHRRKRQNREAQGRLRLRNGQTGTPEAQERERVIKAAYDRWQHLTALRPTQLAALDQRVRDAQTAYHAVCAERKLVRAQVDAEIAEARAAYQEAKENPPE